MGRDWVAFELSGAFGTPLDQFGFNWNFAGSGGQLVAYRVPDFASPREFVVLALDYSWLKGWQVEEVFRAEGSQAGIVRADRQGRRLFLSAFSYGKVLVEYVRTQQGWTEASVLEIEPPDGLYWVGPGVSGRSFAYCGSFIAALTATTDGLGNPIGPPETIEIYRRQGDAFRLVRSRSTNGAPWGLAATSGMVFAYGGGTDLLGNPLPGTLEIYDPLLRWRPVDSFGATRLETDGRRLIASDTRIDFLGNAIGGEVVIYSRSPF